jgi:hypothetical protein
MQAQDVRLALELHIGLVQHVDAVERHVLGGQQRAPLLSLLGEEGAHVSEGELVEPAVDGVHEVVAQVSQGTAERRGDARQERHDDRRHAKLAGDGYGVQRPSAAEGDKREVARIVAALDRDCADGPGLAVVADADDGLSRRARRHAQRGGDTGGESALHIGDARCLGYAEQPRWIESSEVEVGVGDRRLVATAAIADRAGHGPGAGWADAQQAGGVHGGDAAAASANRHDVDHRDAHRHRVLDLLLSRDRRLPADDDADVVARAAHIAGDDVVESGQPGDVRCGDHAGGRAGGDGVDSARDRHAGRRRAAVRLHDQELAGKAVLLQALLERAEVASNERLDTAVDGHGRDALELAELG